MKMCIEKPGDVNYLSVLFRIFVLGLISLFVLRTVTLLSFGNKEVFANYFSDIVRAYGVGLRFDAKVLAIGLFPLLVFAIISIPFSSARYTSVFLKIVFSYSFALLLAIFLIGYVNFYFYKFFQVNINVLVFGILEDDTAAILKSVWTDYPVFLILSIISVVGLCIWHTLKICVYRCGSRKFHLSYWLRFSGVFIVVLFWVFMARGSFETSPLDARSTTISTNEFVNSLASNGVFALKTAFSDKKASKINPNSAQFLLGLGFKDSNQALASYLGVDPSCPVEGLECFSVTDTSTNLLNAKPNVVFILMEGFSQYYYNLNSAKFNLLCGLDTMLEQNQAYVFNRIVSSCATTIYSLENLLIGTPISPISQSEYYCTPFSTAVTKPFKENGYTTSFVTGGKLGWRNLDKFLVNQYFDSVEGDAALKRYCNDAKSCEWGIHDESIYERVMQKLNDSKGTPQFIFALTISHHTPFDIPVDYEAQALVLPNELKQRLRTDEKLAFKGFKAFQYANYCLVNFLKDIQRSPFAANTIVAITGDHNTLQFVNFDANELLIKHSVPFIILAPTKYRPVHNVDNQIVGSHRNVFPTIFNLALSNTRYFNTGESLINPKGVKSNFGVYNYNTFYSSSGVVIAKEPPLYFAWDSTNKNRLSPVSQPSQELLDLQQRANAYVATMGCEIIKQISPTKQKVH